MLSESICFIGAGAMAEAIIGGLLEKKLTRPDRIFVLNKADDMRLKTLKQRYGIVCPEPERKADALRGAQIVVLAVKPKDVAEAMTAWGSSLRSGQHVLLSVVAGISTHHLEGFVRAEIPIVRAMPNTSCTVGRSATGLAAGRWARPAHVKLAEQLFQSVGTVVTLDEEQLDAVTGLSGSGPAYVYYLVEAMEQAGIDAGLRPETARQLTVQTLIGAAEMLAQTNEEPALLREKITSPGGTTFAGLEVLRAHDFSRAVQAAVLSARDRAKQLGEQLAPVGGILHK